MKIKNDTVLILGVTLCTVAVIGLGVLAWWA